MRFPRPRRIWARSQKRDSIVVQCCADDHPCAVVGHAFVAALAFKAGTRTASTSPSTMSSRSTITAGPKSTTRSKEFEPHSIAANVRSSPADNSPASPRRGPPSLPRSTGANGTPSPGLTRTRRRHRPRLVSVRSDVTRVGVRVARVDHDDQGGQWRLRLDRGRLAYRLPSVTSRKLRGSPRQWRARR